jgi:hypothetical protein
MIVCHVFRVAPRGAAGDVPYAIHTLSGSFLTRP